MNEKINRWMQGRNGADALANVVVLLSLVLCIVNLFVRSMALNIVILALLGYGWFRMTSRNVARRFAENQRFLSKTGPLRPWLRDFPAALQESRQFRHFKCPKCKQRVRVPRGKGRVRVSCPKCHTKFDARS